MNIVNKIDACSDGKKRARDLESISCVMLHRIGPQLGIDLVNNAEGVSKWFQRHEEAMTGREMPYTFIICPDGTVEQALAISDTGPHAKKFNVPALSVAFIGDFRKNKCPAAQYQAAIALCSLLVSWIGCGPAGIYSHTEKIPEGASSDKTKDCPGKTFDMTVFRAEVNLALMTKGYLGLGAVGAVF